MAQKKIQPNQLDDSIVTQSELDAAIAEIPEPVLDHGALTGLADDDHTQYHNDARGDARYNTKSEITTALSGKANTSHTHAQADVTNLTTDLAAKAPLASPALTGTPTAPTPTEGDDSTKIATTAFVQANSGAGYVAQDTAPADTEVLWYDTDDTGDSAIGNHADTVDGYHANSTATASTLLPLDSNAKFSILNISNPYRFRAYRDTSHTSASGVNTKIPYNLVEYDPNSNFNTTTNRYTAPVTGTYHFDARFSVASSSAVSFIMLYINGSMARRGTLSKANAEYNGHVVSDSVQLNAGDYVEVFYFVGAALALETNATHLYFSGFLINANAIGA